MKNKLLVHKLTSVNLEIYGYFFSNIIRYINCWHFSFTFTLSFYLFLRLPVVRQNTSKKHTIASHEDKFIRILSRRRELVMIFMKIWFVAWNKYFFVCFRNLQIKIPLEWVSLSDEGHSQSERLLPYQLKNARKRRSNYFPSRLLN